MCLCVALLPPHSTCSSSAGGKVLGEIAGKITCVEKLDVADNGLGDQGLSYFIEGVCNNSCITELNVDNNYKESSEKNRSRLMKQLKMLTTSICPLEIFSFRGSPGKKLGEHLSMLIHLSSHFSMELIPSFFCSRFVWQRYNY